ncbi:predicted ATPase [Hoeflea halophila]|uniref:Predicted ATPase n=1 Tax=Hoeflea halophila TaxID=714899 RepID=A0A286ID07_9HYPH|nr:AAA family ATPase [Hoeflea halophila]SOE17952.1 predicted ATPase [Hoeflea halophila]
MANFVITGASGAGKSSLIAALSEKGYRTVPEAGRQIVAEQLAAQGAALPWEDRAAFMHLLFARSIAAFDQVRISDAKWVIHDRSFVEAIAYCTVISQPVPEQMLQAAIVRRFDQPVFVCPPWREIFEQDAERQHDFQFALRDYEVNTAAYAEAGYDLVEVPRLPVPDRVTFVEQALAELPKLKPSNRAQKG